jgi:hypothetical protein
LIRDPAALLQEPIKAATWPKDRMPALLAFLFQSGLSGHDPIAEDPAREYGVPLRNRFGTSQALSDDGGLRLEKSMSETSTAQRLSLLAIVKGLREGGEIGERSLTAIAGELRAACTIADEMGHPGASDALRNLAECIESGRVE